MSLYLDVNIVRRVTTALLRFIKQLNLFNTHSTNEKQIRREILTTRIYLILLPTILTILVVYSAQKELYYTVQVNNPTLDTYQRLLNAYPDTLVCPCSQISLPYSSFVTLTPRFHPICSSDFVLDPWLAYLYHDDASSYIPIDIRSVGNAQFQLLRTLCESSKQAIDNVFKATFTSALFISSHGILLESELVHIQVQAFADDFISNIASEQRRQRTLFATFFERNFLVSALETSAIPIIDATFNLKMKIAHYLPAPDGASSSVSLSCTCDATYACGIPLGIHSNSLYESDYSPLIGVSLQADTLLTNVNGFQSGCLPFGSLLLSTLECYSNQSCLDNIMDYLSTSNTSFEIFDSSILNRSTPTSLIGKLADKLMVEQWSIGMNYSRYFAACRPLSCSYTYTERFSILYIVTTLIGLLGGLIAILRVVCPQLTQIFYQIQKYILVKRANDPTDSLVLEQRQPLKIRIRQLFNKLRDTLLTLNLFERRNSETSDIQEQIYTTRFYISCLFIFTLILVSVTTLEQRMITTIVSMPTVTEFENLYQSGKLSQSCPCSQIAIQRSKFISLMPTFHQVCSSQLISDDWLDRLTYTTGIRSTFYYLDIRSYGLDMFRTVSSFCSLVNDTTTDAMTSFLTTDWIDTEVLPRQQFNEQVQALIIDFQLGIENTFKQMFSIAHEINQCNQVLSSRVSNFFFDGIFDSNDGHLISVQTYTGTVSSVADILPSCSCILNRCSQRLGFYDMNNDDQTFTLIVDVPGMYSACYPLDGFRMSTFECWFNETCIALVLSHLVPFPVKYYLNPLNSSMLIRFSPTTTIGDIIDDLMIEMWTNVTNYETYYNICRPLTCAYTSYRRFDWLYTITILMSIFGGLSVSLQIICSLLVKLYFNWRRKRTGTTSSESAIVRVGLISKTVNQVRRLLLTINLFDSDSPHAHIQRRERLSTRLYIISLVITVAFLFIYMLFVQHTRAVTVKFPSSNHVAQLQDKYSMTLSCPCMQTSMPYSTFLSLKVINYHPICSSPLLSQNYLEVLLGDNLTVVPESTSFKRQFLVGQLSLLASLCTLSNQTVNTSVALFLHQQFITAQVLTVDQFYEQINASINRFYLGMSLSLRHSLDYLQAITHGNAIMSSYVSNWRFQPSSVVNSSTIRTRPIWYGNCSCASSTQCSLPMTIGNITFAGLAVGCLPSTVLLQATLECFYNQTCLDTLHYAFFGSVSIPSLPVSINMSKYFLHNISVGSLFDELFVESWFHQYDYEAFFRTCGVSMCTYTYNLRPDMLYIVTTIIGLVGGLTVVFRLICPFLIKRSIYLIDRIRKKSSTAVEIYTLPVQLSKDIMVSNEQQVIVRTQPHLSVHWWRNNRRTQIMAVASIIIVILIIILTVVPVMIKRLSSSFPTINTSNPSITISTLESLSSTMTAPITQLCSAGAIWKREAVTVAGFATGIYSTSLAALHYPADLFIDAIGNMHILDAFNYRILYWPINSAEGRIVAGTNEPGSEANQFNMMAAFTIGQGQMYVSDAWPSRVRSFAFSISTGSPNGTTILGDSLDGSDRSSPILVMGMAFDEMRSLLYLSDYLNQRLIIMNRTENNTQIVSDTELLVMNSSIQIYPTGIVIDEASDSFYVSDAILNVVVKFKFGSTTGTIIAGSMISDSIYNQLMMPVGLALDSSGYLYIADMQYNRIVQVQNDNGDLRTIAGNGFFGTSPARLTMPNGMKFDQYHNLYVADSLNNRIQRFDLLYNGC